MACSLPTTDQPGPETLIGRPMTRCECSGVSFDEAARRLETERMSLDELSRRTGCGGTCTACIPELRRYLAAMARRRTSAE
jgi:bacterioferritin-associated ferredoxin